MRLQTILMTLVIVQQLGEGRCMELAMKLTTDEGPVVKYEEQSKEEQPSGWWSFLVTVLMIVGWELVKLLLEAMAQEKIMKMWKSWFAKPGVNELEGIDVVANVEAGVQPDVTPDAVSSGSTKVVRPKKAYMTTNKNTRDPRVHLYGDCHRLLTAYAHKEYDVCWHCAENFVKEQDS